MEKLSDTKPPLNPRMIYNKRYNLVLAIFEFVVLFVNNLFFKQMSFGIIQKGITFVATPVVIVDNWLISFLEEHSNFFFFCPQN